MSLSVAPIQRFPLMLCPGEETSHAMLWEEASCVATVMDDLRRKPPTLVLLSSAANLYRRRPTAGCPGF